MWLASIAECWDRILPNFWYSWRSSVIQPHCVCCNPDGPAEWLNDFGVRISWSLNLSLHLSPNPVLAIAATPIVACTAHNSICKVAKGGTVQEIKLQQICRNDWTKCVPKSENIHLTWECCSMLNHWMRIFNPRCAQIPWCCYQKSWTAVKTWWIQAPLFSG